jgi:NDP-sugar pyrophosphorylase family protein
VLKPKPMVEIGDMPIIWHIMKIYSSLGFNVFIYYVTTKNAGIAFVYNLVKKKQFNNPFRLFKEHLRMFAAYKEVKLKKRQQKHIRSTLKNEW